MQYGSHPITFSAVTMQPIIRRSSELTIAPSSPQQIAITMAPLKVF
jgi:hypothetical protein